MHGGFLAGGAREAGTKLQGSDYHTPAGVQPVASLTQYQQSMQQKQWGISSWRTLLAWATAVLQVVPASSAAIVHTTVVHTAIVYISARSPVQHKKQCA